MTTTTIPSLETYYRDLTAWRDAGEPSTGSRAMRIAGGSDLNPLAKTGRPPRNFTSNPTPRRVRRRDPRTTDYRWDAERCCSVPLDPVTHEDLPPLEETETMQTETTPATPGRIYAAIADIMSEVQPIGKDRRNPQQDYAFRGIDDCYNMLHPLLAKHRVFLTPEVVDKTVTERQTRNGGALIYTSLTVRFTIHAEDGSSLSVTTVGEAMDAGDKSSNKAMSAAMKYALIQLFAIPTAGDNDSENATHRVDAEQPEPKPYSHPRAQLLHALQERGLDHGQALKTHGWFLRQCGGQPTAEDCRQFRADIVAGMFDHGIPQQAEPAQQPAGEQDRPAARLDLRATQQRLVAAMQARGIDRPDAVRLYAGWLKQHKRPSASAVEAFAAAIDNGDLDHAAQLDAAAA